MLIRNFFIRRGHHIALPLASPPKSLCLLRLSALGDVCHAVPIIRTLQAFWPETQLTWVIGRFEAQLIGDISGVEFIIFDKSDRWRAYLKLRREMKKRRFDLLLHMQTSMRANIASFCIPADICLGFDRARAKDSQWAFTTHQIPTEPKQHVMEGFFGFLKAIGLSERCLKWEIPIPVEAIRFAQGCLPGHQKTLVISTGTSQRFRNFRNWSADGYAAVADYAAKKHGMRVILTGGPTPAEEEDGRTISALAQCNILNLIGKTGLKELFAILSQATVLVSPDSGPVHMANTLGIPVIGLYATSNPARTGPYFSQRWLVNKYPEAIRSALGKSVEEVPWGARVRREDIMALIGKDEVIAKLQALMASIQETDHE